MSPEFRHLEDNLPPHDVRSVRDHLHVIGYLAAGFLLGWFAAVKGAMK